MDNIYVNNLFPKGKTGRSKRNSFWASRQGGKFLPVSRPHPHQGRAATGPSGAWLMDVQDQYSDTAR